MKVERRGGRRIPWSNSEDVELERMWGTDMTTMDMARRLGRSARAIELRATVLDLPRPYTRRNPPVTRAGAQR